MVDVDFNQLPVSETEKARLFGFESAFPLTMIVLGFNFGVLAVVLGVVVQQLFEEAREFNTRELLIFACSPADPEYTLPSVPEEAQKVKGTVETLSTRARRKICEACSGTADDLRRELNAVPTRRFLFSGHANARSPTRADVSGHSGASCSSEGRIRTLVFTDTDGGVDIVEPELLIAILGLSSAGDSRRRLDQLELVFLNGCESENLGTAVCQAGVRSVVCWLTKVRDDAASLFAIAFFEAVSNGHDIQRAYANAVLALRVQHYTVDRAPPRLRDVEDPFAEEDSEQVSDTLPKAPLANRISAVPGQRAAGIPILLVKSGPSHDNLMLRMTPTDVTERHRGQRKVEPPSMLRHDADGRQILLRGASGSGYV